MIDTVRIYFLGMMSRYLFFYKQNHLNLIASAFDNRSLIKIKYFISTHHLRVGHPSRTIHRVVRHEYSW
jgi:hypothetical protein